MSERDYIHRLDLPLYIDVNCYQCKRLCALSNTIEYDGRHYCGACAGFYRRGQSVVDFCFDYEPEIIQL